MSEERNRGFSGLDSLVPKEPGGQVTPVSMQADSDRDPQNLETTEKRPVTTPVLPVSDQPPLWKQKWLWLVLGIGVFVWIANSDDGKKSNTSTYSSSSVSSALSETRPTGYGGDRVLSASEIYYCLAEDVRLAAANGAINRYDNYAIDRYNAGVNDYNQRCGSYKYRQSDMNRARSALESNRLLIEIQGSSRY